MLDPRHCRKCAFTNVTYVDPNMDSIFEFNNLRFSTELFCHISVIKDDCVVSEWRGKPKIDAESPAPPSLLMLRLFLFECVAFKQENALLAFSTFCFLP